MGTAYKFTCTKCGYSATVSGGRDFGMVAVVKTMMCKDCEEVVDVLIGRYGENGPTGDPEYDVGLKHCPECDGSNLHSWPRRHPCPQCDGEMKEEPGMDINWD